MSVAYPYNDLARWETPYESREKERKFLNRTTKALLKAFHDTDLDSFTVLSEKRRFEILLVLYCDIIRGADRTRLQRILELLGEDMFFVTENIQVLKMCKLIETDGDSAKITGKGFYMMVHKIGITFRMAHRIFDSCLYKNVFKGDWDKVFKNRYKLTI